VSYTFEEVGVFPYFCVFHPAMVGAVVVGDGAADGDAAAANKTATEDGGGASASTIAGIIAAVTVGAAAVGLVGNRVLSRRGEEASGA
jgi:hypothetical protein